MTPQFSQLPSSMPPVLRQFLTIVASLLFAFWVTLPTLFKRPGSTVTVHPIVKRNQLRTDWNNILNAKRRLGVLAAAIREPAVVVGGWISVGPDEPDPLMNPQKYVNPGEGIAVLVDAYLRCNSGAGRSGEIQFFYVVCSPNPATYDVMSWTHEKWHVALGHGNIRHTFLGRWIAALPELIGDAVNLALNTFLDFGYVVPAMIAGEYGAQWFQMIMFLSFLGHLWSKR